MTPLPLALQLSMAGGSAPGRAHQRALRNNQDAVAVRADGDVLVAAVADGCSAGRSSEVGARFAVAWIVAWAPLFARSAPPSDAQALADRVADGLRSALADLATHLAPEPAQRPAVVAEHLLFSFLAVVVTPARAVVLGVGDGLHSVNGDVVALDAGPDNAPAYLGYSLLEPGASGRAARELRARVHANLPTHEVDTLVIGTDGAADLENGAEPAAATLAELTLEARRTANPSLLQKRLLALAGRDPRLQDDVTLAILTRRAVPS